MSTLYSISSDTLTGLADAVRQLNGTSAPLSPDDMIDGIEGHVCPSPTIQSLSVTQNGEYTAPSGVDGYSPITVNVSGGGGGGANTQVLFVSGKTTATGRAVLLSSITVAKTGIYTVEWIMSRGANGTSVRTCLYINNNMYGSDWTFDNSTVEFNRLALPSVSGVSLNAGDVVEIKGGIYSGTGTVYAASLIIQEETT